MEEIQTIKQVEGKLKFLDAKNDKLQPVELWCLNEKINRNGWKYESIATHLDEFKDIPILTAYLMDGAVIADGHNFSVKRDRQTGKEYASFTAADAERIVGWIDRNASVSIQKDEDGIDWVVCQGNLFKFYCYELVQKLKNQGFDGMSVSIETLVTSEDIIDGIAYEHDYIVLGVTILNESVAPAVESASIRTLSHLSDIRDGMKEVVLKAASYIEDTDKKNVQEKNESMKEEKALTYFSKKQCADLSKRFDGYTVLAAAQDENNVIHVALLSKNGDTAVYNMNSVDETIAVERIRSCNGTVAFDCGDNNCVNADLECVLEEMNEVINEANENCKNAQDAEQKANEALSTAMATITEMRNAENARRIETAKACASRTLSAFNASSDFEIPSSALSEINADIDKGMYTERVNAEGKWIGEDEVIMRVKSLCADKQKEMNDAKVAKNKSVHIWEKLNGTFEDDGSVAALLKRKGIE